MWNVWNVWNVLPWDGPLRNVILICHLYDKIVTYQGWGQLLLSITNTITKMNPCAGVIYIETRL